MPTVRAIGWKIKELRNQRDMKQEVLAEEIDCSCRYVQRVEAGEQVTAFYLRKIATVFGCEMEELIRGDPTGDGILGQEWDVDNQIRRQRRLTAANGLGYEVFQIPSRNLPIRSARAKLYDTTRLSPQNVERTQAILNRHPQICYKLRDVDYFPIHITSAPDERPGFWWVLDEWIAGETLAKSLTQPPDFGSLKTIGLQLLDALEILHANGIIRRELTPQSIVVPADKKRVVLTDLEMGKLLQGVPTVAPEGRWRSNDFLAPEIVAGGDAEPSSDWFSWAKIMLHGIHGAEREKHDAEPTAVPSQVQDLLERCIALPPSDRPQSVKAIRKQFKQWKT